MSVYESHRWPVRARNNAAGAVRDWREWAPRAVRIAAIPFLFALWMGLCALPGHLLACVAYGLAWGVGVNLICWFVRRL